MKHFIGILFLIALIMPVVVLAHTEDNPYVTDLIAGGGEGKSAMVVGDVSVWNGSYYLYVKYVISDPNWCITETHLHVAHTFDMIPQKKGNPIPGLFEYSDQHDCVTEFTYMIPLTGDFQGLYLKAGI